MSITKRAAILGFGSLWRISYFLYDEEIASVEVAAAGFDLGFSIGGGVSRWWPLRYTAIYRRMGDLSEEEEEAMEMGSLHECSFFRKIALKTKMKFDLCL